MKTKYYFLAALATAVFASCTSDDYVGDATLTAQANGPGAIEFAGGAPAITRADLYGSDAAAKLGNKFVVYGTKHDASEEKDASHDVVVFNNYQVGWTANTAGTTASNSSDWDYVTLPSYTTPASGGTSSQAIKYWDYSNVSYTFYAFSSSDISYPADGSDKVSISKIPSDGTSVYNKGYDVSVAPTANLNNLFFSDRVPVTKANYDKTVNFTFRNIGAKVRVGFYETIHGYSVKIDKFYIDDANSAPVIAFSPMNDNKADGFYASLQNVKRDATQALKVTYYDATTATQVINRPKMTNPSEGYDYYLKLGDGSQIINKTLATSAATPTWVAGVAGDNYYIPVFPFEDNTNPMLLKLDFTMYPEDNSADVIHVRGARAIVPVKYVQWKSNFAYTYIFKISDATNGTTGNVDENDDPVDPQGLKPITFDAIAVDVTDELQETITTIETNSITTYAEGAITDDYTAGKPIYIAVSNMASGTPVITPTAIGTAATQAQVYKLSGAATEAEVLGNLNGLPMGITLTATTGTEEATIQTTVPLTDGTTPSISNVKFTPSAEGYYAYVYTKTAYVATTYNSEAAGTYDPGETYYMRSGASAPYVYYAVPVADAAAFDANKANLWTVNVAGTSGEYDVKVIKVVAAP